jgi:hypothetical protein
MGVDDAVIGRRKIVNLAQKLGYLSEKCGVKGAGLQRA